MSDREPKLFDDTKYSPYQDLIAMLGCDVGARSHQQPYLKITFNNQLSIHYEPYYGDQDSHTLSGYGEGDEAESFAWVAREGTDTKVSGFLYGLTSAQTEGKPLFLHIFTHYTDIDGTSMGILLRDIRKVEVASDMEEMLVSDLHNSQVDHRSARFEVPVLWDVRRGEFIKRPAKPEDIEAALGSLSLPPATTYRAPLW